ncbi:MAG: ABC transporter substrate-binding protein [bacterium]
MRTLFTFLLAGLLSFTFSCKKSGEVQETSEISSKQTEIKYAKGFTITDYETYKELKIINPWQNADKTFTYAITSSESTKNAFDKEKYDGVIELPLTNIVATSTTHIPFLELLNEEHALVGFPGCDYISSEKTRNRINAGKITELGATDGMNTEVLLELQPNAIITFGVDGTNKSLSVIQVAKIPILYNGDWMEDSPLAKAEWIKFFGVLFDKQDQASVIFKQIESDYLEAKKLALQASKSPTVMAGAMHKDVWYLPNGKSPEALFLNDANAHYLWKNTEGNGSLALSIENVIEKAQNADIWISPSYYRDYQSLGSASEHYDLFKPFKEKQIYSFTNTTGETGGVLYYELGVARPDLVLKDLIKICHPELLSDYQTTFFKPF